MVCKKIFRSGRAWKIAGISLFVFLLTNYYTIIIAGENDGCAHSEFTAYNYKDVTVENARVLLLTENITGAVTIYAQLVSSDSANVELNSEYAYALALNGIYDASLIRIDRIWDQKAGNTEVSYFTSQIFALMGFDQLAGEFWNDTLNNNSPRWIDTKAPEMIRKYKRKQVVTANNNHDDLVSKFKYANRLTAQNLTVQSLASFEEIVNQYPDEYLPYVGYSIALEKAGLIKESVRTIESALRIVGDNPENQDTKQFLDQRLAALNNKIQTQEKNPQPGTPSLKEAGDNNSRLIAYAGGFIAKSYSTVNARFGNYFTKSSYISADLGFSGAGGQSFINAGFSVFNRQGIFAEGFGLTGAFSNGSNAFFAKISVGLSFMNKSRTSSLDIFLDGRMPLTKGGVTTVGLSIGQSIYFGKRK